MQITYKEYSDHKIFNELKSYADFYDLLSGSIMSFVLIGTSAITFDTYVLTSMQGTVESINLLLRNGRMNDAYALVRK